MLLFQWRYCIRIENLGQEIVQLQGERPTVRKFLVVIVDRNTVGNENVVLLNAKFLENLGIKVGRSSYYGLTLFVCSFFIKTSVVTSWNPVNSATNKQ